MQAEILALIRSTKESTSSVEYRSPNPVRGNHGTVSPDQPLGRYLPGLRHRQLRGRIMQERIDFLCHVSTVEEGRKKIERPGSYRIRGDSFRLPIGAGFHLRRRIRINPHSIRHIAGFPRPGALTGHLPGIRNLLVDRNRRPLPEESASVVPDCGGSALDDSAKGIRP